MTKTEDISLVVLSHGLWGTRSHMSYIENELVEKYGDFIHILNSSVNEAKYSYDGIDICGERLVKDIESTIVRLNKNGKKVKKISFIGYSLGGLIVRYAIGLLGKKGLFDTIEPDYFVTFATPHMGVRLPSTSVFSYFFKLISGRLVSRSGEQLQLLDTFDKKQNKSILEVMSDPDQIYFKFLSKFNYRRTYANVANDRTVPYWTAGIEIMDYFYDSKGKIDFTLDQKYMSVVTAFDARMPDNKKKLVAAAYDKKNKPTWKPILLKCVFYCCFPVLFPIFFVLAMSYVGIQGLVSRHRVSRLLHQQQLLITSSNSEETLPRRSSEGDRYVNGEILTGALDVVNLPGEQDTPALRHSTSKSNHGSSDTEYDDYYYKVQPTETVLEKCKQLNFDDKTKRIHSNLRLLEWERVWTYLKAFNAHGSIVCRQKRFTTDGGRATIQHFIDTTQLGP